MYPEGLSPQSGDGELTKRVLEQENPEEAWNDVMKIRLNMERRVNTEEEDDEKMAEEDDEEQILKEVEKKINVSIVSSKVKKSLKIPSLENDLINDVLGKDECVHDLDIDVMDFDPDSESDDWNIEDEDSSIDSDEIQGIDDLGEGVQPEKNRNLSHLKPWEKTLSEFVVGHMSHDPCGPNVPGGTKRRCWIGGKCVSTSQTLFIDIFVSFVVRKQKCHESYEMSPMEM